MDTSSRRSATRSASRSRPRPRARSPAPSRRSAPSPCEDWPDAVTIRARMALHSGECTERDSDYFGPTVNRAARLEAIAHGGQLVLSARDRRRAGAPGSPTASRSAIWVTIA